MTATYFIDFTLTDKQADRKQKKYQAKADIFKHSFKMQWWYFSKK